MLARQRLALPGMGEHRIRHGEFGERQVGAVAVIAVEDGEARLRLRPGQIKRRAGRAQAYSGLPNGEGSFDYSTLAADYVGKYQRFWDETAQVPWLYDPESGTMISYDDPESLTKKAEYIKQHNLGGVMFWETSQDDANNSLLNALYTTLNGGCVQND